MFTHVGLLATLRRAARYHEIRDDDLNGLVVLVERRRSHLDQSLIWTGPRGPDRGRSSRGDRLPGGHRRIAARPGAGSAQAETQGLREVGASVRTTHVATGAAVKKQNADVSHNPRRIENKRPPATGSTQGANLVDRTNSTLATTAPERGDPSRE